MENLARFMQYAAAFEQTLVDDDWSRLRQYFADDALYEVKADAFGCSLRGTDAIFTGIRKSLNGMDRKFDGRSVDVTDGPHAEGDDLRMAWTLTYRKQGKTPYVLRGRTEVRYRDGKIAYMADSYDPSVGPEAATWMQQNDMLLDPSYV